MIRARWPRADILVRADSNYAAPEVFDLCRTLVLATNAALRAHGVPLEASTRARATGPDNVRRFSELHDAARSWHRVERIIARVEAGPQGVDTRFNVTSRTGGRGKGLYEQVFCRRGVAENHIKSCKTNLAADRTSCTRATANQMHLMLHTGAYWLMWRLHSLMPRRSLWRTAKFDTLRLRLLKVAARVVAMKTKLHIHLPTACTVQPVLAMVLKRTTCLVT